MRRGILQVLREHGAQGFAGSQATVGRHKDFGFTPAQRHLVIVCYQNANSLLLSTYRRFDRSCLQTLQRSALFPVLEADHVDPAHQDSEQQQGNRNLEVSGNHGRPPACPLAWRSPVVSASANVARSFWLSRARGESEAHSMAMAGAVRLFNGRS